jgi:hypothetical protein
MEFGLEPAESWIAPGAAPISKCALMIAMASGRPRVLLGRRGNRAFRSNRG